MHTLDDHCGSPHVKLTASGVTCRWEHAHHWAPVLRAEPTPSESPGPAGGTCRYVIREWRISPPRCGYYCHTCNLHSMIQPIMQCTAWQLDSDDQGHWVFSEQRDAAADDNGDAFGGGRFAKRSPGPVDHGHLLRYGLAADGTPWVLRQIGAAQIEGICRSKVRVDPDAVLSKSSGPEGLSAAVAELRRAADAAAAAGGEPDTLDPIADLKVSTLDLVTAIRERQTLLARRAAMPCHR